MKINNFIKELEDALVERGVHEDTAKKHVANLLRSFTNDDLNEINAIETPAEVAALADSIAAILNKGKKNTASEKASPAPAVQRETVADKSEVKNIIPKEPTTHKPENIPVQKKALYAEPNEVFVKNDYGRSESSKGSTIFWVGLFVTLPITLTLLAIGFGVFIAAFAALIGIIIAAVAILVGVVAIGSAASLVGIIYGVTQLFSFPAAGIYEIGLGIIVAGAVLFAAILIYNFAIRFIPWVISWLAVFFKYSCKKLVVLFNYVRKECYKL